MSPDKPATNAALANYPVGTLTGHTIIGPCGYGVEVVEDTDGRTVTYEEYTGDRDSLRRDYIQRVL